MVEHFVELLLAELVPLEAVWLDGSRARGEVRQPGSDVDRFISAVEQMLAG